MLTHDYSYDACLQGSVTKAWTVEDCFRGRDFDFDKPFLPDRIAGVERHRLPRPTTRSGCSTRSAATATATSSPSSRSTSFPS